MKHPSSHEPHLRAIPDFSLVRVECNDDLLRQYIIQGATDSFGFSEDWLEALRSTAPIQEGDELDDDIARIVGDMPPDHLRDFLDDCVPEYFYYWPWEGMGTPEHLFTDIVQCSFDRGGLIVLMSYENQIYTLFTAKGIQLTDNCHDLDLGTDGLVLHRSSSARSAPIFRLEQFDGRELSAIDMFGPFQSQDAIFPYIQQRDLIPIQSGYVHFDPEKHELPLEEETIRELIGAEPDLWRFLTPMVSSIELAAEMVSIDVTAFTLLNEHLRTDVGLIELLMQELSDYQSNDLFHFLNPQQRKLPAVAHHAVGWGLPYVQHVGLIEDIELLFKHVARNHQCLHAAPSSMLEDRDVMLGFCALNWKALIHACPDQLADLGFIEEAIRRFNDRLQAIPHGDSEEKEDWALEWERPHRKEAGLKEVLDSILQYSDHASAILPHLPEPESIGDCIQQLRAAAPNKTGDDALFRRTLQGLPDRFKLDPTLWPRLEHMAPVADPLNSGDEQRMLWLTSLMPESLLADPSKADALIESDPAFYFHLSKELQSDPRLLELTLSQWKAKQHSGRIAERIVALSLHCDAAFMQRAISKDSKLISSACDDLLDDAEFMISLIPATYGWCYNQASERLQSDIGFADAVYEHNPNVSREFKASILSSGKYEVPPDPFAIAD